MSKLTTEELQKSIASFLMILGRHIPASYAQNIQKEVQQLADEQIRYGHTNVGTATIALADALCSEPGAALPKRH